MDQYYRKIAEKYFRNECTPHEAKQVLKWLDTPGGKEYLHKKMKADFISLDAEHEISAQGLKQIDPERHFNEILSSIHHLESNEASQSRRDYVAPLLKVAAGFLILALASLFVYTSGSLSVPEEQAADIVLTTDDHQQREITLNDGTVVYLNKNSSLVISEVYATDKREVYLEGEAYFEVAHNAELPFIIQTDYSEVEVLGTSFNVKSGSELVEVAVLEGRVAFKDSREGKDDQVILQKGEYAYLDLERNQIKTENFGVENYLAWKNRELHFDQLTMENVCVQIDRFYDVSCDFENETIKERKLTANVPNDDFENILSVIASSLYLEYGYDDTNGQIHWSESEAINPQEQAIE